MSTRAGGQAAEAQAEPVAELVRVPGLLELVRVRAERRRGIRVPEQGGDVDRFEAKPDDQHRGEAVPEAVGADAGQLRPLERGGDRARRRAVVAAAAGPG